MTDPAVPSPSTARPSRTEEASAELRLEDVYREHFAFVWRSLRHLGVSESDVDDALQDVFLVVNAKLSSFEHRSRLSTWIYGICMNVAQARRRRAHVRHELPTDPRAMPLEVVDGPLPDDDYEQREAASLLDAILDTLPIEQRAVFTLFEIDGQTCEEIARLCSIPLGTVYSRLRLAREAFKRASARVEARARFMGGST